MASSIDLDSLPDGVHVLSSMSCRQKGGPMLHLPYGFRDNEEVIILTSTGEIGQYHPNSLTNSFRSIINLNTIEEMPQFVKKEITHLKTYHSMTLFSAIISACWALTCSFAFVELINNFNSPPPLAEIDTNYVASSAITSIFYLILMPVIFFPWFISYFLERWAIQESLTISTPTGKHIFYGVFPFEWRLRIFRFCMLMAFIVFIPLAMRTDTTIYLLVLYGLIFFIIIVIWLIDKLFNDNEIDDYRGAQKLASMSRFNEAIVNIYKPVSTDGAQYHLITVEERLGEKISKLKERLEGHETVLDQLTESQWPLVFKAQTEYMGMTQIRRCTEKILLPKVEALGIDLSATNRGLTAIRSILTKNKAIEEEALTDLQIIEAITHPTAHGFSRSQEKYMTAFKSFVNLVEWSFDTSEEE